MNLHLLTVHNLPANEFRGVLELKILDGRFHGHVMQNMGPQTHNESAAMLRNSSIYDSKATLQNNLKGEKRFFKIVCAGCKMMGRCTTSSSFKLITIILF